MTDTYLERENKERKKKLITFILKWIFYYKVGGELKQYLLKIQIGKFWKFHFTWQTATNQLATIVVVVNYKTWGKEYEEEAGK